MLMPPFAYTQSTDLEAMAETLSHDFSGRRSNMCFSLRQIRLGQAL